MFKNIIQLNDGIIKNELKELVCSSMEEALTEMYLARLSVRRVEDITEALWGTKVLPFTISEMKTTKKARSLMQRSGKHTRY